MKRSYIGLALGALVAAGAVLSLPSCGHDQKLVGLQIQPQTFTFLTPDTAAKEQFKAIGTYIHPPETKDITSQVTWSVDFQRGDDESGPGLSFSDGGVRWSRHNRHRS